MTFYWWSHWFWITAFWIVLLLILPSTSVRAYPSQESSPESANQNSPLDVKAGVTKLYQSSGATSTTLDWAATTQAPTPSIIAEDVLQEERENETAIERTRLQSITPQGIGEAATPGVGNSEETALLASAPSASMEEEEQQGEAEGRNVAREEEEEAEEPVAHLEDAEDADMEEAMEEGGDVDELMSDDGDLEFKRSAEVFNKTDLPAKAGDLRAAEQKNKAAPAVALAAAVVDKPRELSNYSNFTVARLNATATNSSSSNNNTSAEEGSLSPSGFVGTITSIEAAPPEAPRIVPAAGNRSNVAAAAGLPATLAIPSVGGGGSVDQHAAALDEDHSTIDRVAPFTLENANREDELRRAESERNRTRKSKGLTTNADYKHVNRFIAYPSLAAGSGAATDPKNLLARSASTIANTANDADYDGEESNISSEALSIQRAYFLDAGAISAICLTAFGVCCAVGTVGIVLYRRKFVNKPQALSEPDSSVYIDDSTLRVSDNSDEMYSLDNDSFLNSLEAMTIQNYWTDTVKHTKL